MSRLSVLALTLHPPGRAPSQRYRLEAFVPSFAAQGLDVEMANAMSLEDERGFYGTGLRRKATAALRAFGRRLWSVRPRRRKPDVIFVQREAFFLFNDWSEWLASLQAPLVFDFDDAIWIHAVSEANRRFAFLKNVSKIPRIVARAHTVIAGNAYLGAWAHTHNANVHIVPTCVDTDVWTDAPRSTTGPVVIGWCGSPSTIEHFKTVLPALRQVKQRFGQRVAFQVMGAPTFRDEALDVRGVPWSEAAEVKFLQSMHIGLMPLPDDAWTRGKCGLKGLTSMACGAATVMSPVGVNPSIVSHRHNGLLADTHDAWVAALSELIENGRWRETLAQEGRRTVVDGYSVRRWSPVLVDLLRAAANSLAGRHSQTR
jgi:glycosyltransferase involved in cell wall biosynthesis